MDGIRAAKTVLLGAAGVGKTAIVQRICHDTFSTDIEPTLVANFKDLVLSTNRGQICLNIWDTAGQDDFRDLMPMYCRDAVIAVLVYDVTRSETFDVLEKYYDALQNFSPDCVFAIAGNKVDLESDRKISFESGSAYASSINASLFIETSALTGKGIHEMFTRLASDSKLAISNKPASALTEVSPRRCEC